MKPLRQRIYPERMFRLRSLSAGQGEMMFGRLQSQKGRGDDVREATITEGYCQSHTTGERKNPETIQVCVVTGRSWQLTATSKSRDLGLWRQDRCKEGTEAQGC